METVFRILLNTALILSMINLVIVTIKTYKFSKECDKLTKELEFQLIQEREKNKALSKAIKNKLK